ncbi:hypothetical protein BJP40_30910 [Streptomyces sp. CC53]|uniref:hypothetical protein n=1 Tax=unclassified Streptomyces TaxID=2593676 RepID=UPI0008DDBAF0|nr:MULTISPECIES: hypothetical protein [unclassified Streptomyces]OII61815.1 hypothetical protein BJP40_30910 [Streptomyces sp. CC53]
MHPKGPISAAAVTALASLTLLAGPAAPAASASAEESASASSAGGTASADGSGSAHADLVTAYQATLKYHSVERALQDGYRPMRGCIEREGEGGMGYHYVNTAYNNTTDPAHPSALMYEPGPGGTLRLVGIEWFVEDADQDLSTDDDRPAMFGQPFLGPSPGVEEGVAAHYDLHVWIYKPNPKGMFHEWNPHVSCPAD